MAGAALVLCNPLCFLVHRLGKSAVKCLKSSVLDFFSVEELSDAKQRLLQDVANLKLDLNVPHIPERRDGESRAVRVVDDIFTMLTFLDENLRLNLLPKYVAEGPDSMPSTRLYEGDLATVMNLMGKIDGRLEEFGTRLAAILNDVQALQARSTTARSESGYNGQVDLDVRRQPSSIQPRSAVNNQASQSASQSAAMTSQVNIPQTADQPADRTDDEQLRPVLRSGSDWATVVAASSPIAVGNRFASLETIDDGHTDAQPFTEYLSRRTVKRRRRQFSPEQRQQQQQQHQRQQQPGNDQQQDQQNDARRRTNKRVLLGKAAHNDGGLAAAKKITKKAVFCVDNIDPSFDVDDIREFVANLSVEVLSCFRAEPRRQPNETVPISDRRAFRLCIADSDRDRLLDADKWPDSVTISQWYFRPPSDVRRLGAARPAALPAAGSSTTAVASAAVATAIVPASPKPAMRSDTDMDLNVADVDDTTVLYHDAASSSSTVDV